MWTLVWRKTVAALEVRPSRSRSHTSDDRFPVAALCALVAHKQNVAKQVQGAYSHDIVAGPPQIRSVENYAYLTSLS